MAHQALWIVSVPSRPGGRSRRCRSRCGPGDSCRVERRHTEHDSRRRCEPEPRRPRSAADPGAPDGRNSPGRPGRCRERSRPAHAPRRSARCPGAWPPAWAVRSDGGSAGRGISRRSAPRSWRVAVLARGVDRLAAADRPSTSSTGSDPSKTCSKKPMARARSATGGVPPKANRTPPRPEVVGALGEVAQQPLTGLGRQPVGDANQVRAMPARGLQDLLHGHSRPQEDRLPPGRLGQAQEVHHPGHVDAFAQRRSHHDPVAHHPTLRADSTLRCDPGARTSSTKVVAL